MGEASQPYAGNRDWHVACYDTAGQVAVCVIDSDHGAVHISFPSGKREQFFELRAEQVVKFQVALEATLGMIKSSGVDKPVRWEGHCYNSWDELRCCLIEATRHDAVRISCVMRSTGRQEFSLELRENQIGQFQAALAAAMEVFHTDVAIHGKHWADEEADETHMVSPCGMEESAFTQEIHKMVAADAPEMLALVGEIGDRVDAITIAYCLAFPDHAEVISIGPGNMRGSFHSPQHARKLLSAGNKAKIRLVSVTEAQKQTKAA